MTELEERSLDSIERQLAGIIDRRNQRKKWRRALGLFLVWGSLLVMATILSWLLGFIG